MFCAPSRSVLVQARWRQAAPTGLPGAPVLPVRLKPRRSLWSAVGQSRWVDCNPLLPTLVHARELVSATSSATSMAPHAIVSAIQLHVTSLGGQPTLRENELVEKVRKRFNLKLSATGGLPNKVKAFIFGIEPIVNYLQAIFRAKFIALGSAGMGDQVCELFRKCTRATRIPKRFAEIIDDADPWAEVEVAITAMAGGAAAPMPDLQQEAISSNPTSVVVGSPPFWSHKFFVVTGPFLVAWLFFETRHFFVIGRTRFFLFGMSTLFLAIGIAYFLRGAMFFLIGKTTGETEADDNSDDGAQSWASVEPTSPVSAQMGPGDTVQSPESLTVNRLSEEFAEMQELMRHLAGRTVIKPQAEQGSVAASGGAAASMPPWPPIQQPPLALPPSRPRPQALGRVVAAAIVAARAAAAV